VSQQALLIMDMQNGIVDRITVGQQALLDTAASALAAARASSIPVIFVRVAFRAGAPEVSPRNKSFSALAGSSRLDETSDATRIHDRLAPIEGELLVTKRRVSAFAGSDLDVVLRAQDIDSLVLCGIATSGVILSTLRYAADQDFELTVLYDASADGDSEVHRVLMEKVFPRQATVISTAAWVDQLN
jgi:nicotinamidase-related amidase